MSQPSESGSPDAQFVLKTIPEEAMPQPATWFEGVLRATLAICASEKPLDLPDMTRLRDVARRHAESAELTEPIAAELVQAVLAGHLLQKDDADGIGPKAVSQIARSLLEDPNAAARLRRLWERLIGDTS